MVDRKVGIRKGDEEGRQKIVYNVQYKKTQSNA